MKHLTLFFILSVFTFNMAFAVDPADAAKPPKEIEEEVSQYPVLKPFKDLFSNIPVKGIFKDVFLFVLRSIFTSIIKSNANIEFSIIDDADLEKLEWLSKNVTSPVLRIKIEGVNKENIEIFEKLLRHAHMLKKMDLSKSDIGDVGARALLRAKLPAKLEIDLSNNDISEGVKEEIKELRPSWDITF